MYVESFHRVLKIVYLKSKQIRRVDCLMSVLLRFAKDKAFDQISKLEKGKFTHCIKEIVKQHRSAEEMRRKNNSDSLVKNIDNSSWLVSSQSSEDKVYTVKSVLQECSCQLKCSLCNSCVHMYICTCADSHLQTTVCKHSHLVQLHLNSSSSLEMLPENEQEGDSAQTITESCTDGHDGTNNEKAELESAGYFVDILKSSCDTSLNSQKKAISDALYELQILAHSSVNHEVLLTAKKHVMHL